jgi:hypothetical protein
MEHLEARLESIERIEGDLYVATVSVSTHWPYETPRQPDRRLYTLEIDLERRSMKPRGELQECFDVHYRFEHSHGLNPKLRRQWKTASLVDAIVDLLFRSRLLIPWSLLPEDWEVEN